MIVTILTKIKMKYILLFLTTCTSSKISSHAQEYNIFTIQQYNESLNKIKLYTYNDIQKYKLNIDHHINMYSYFTKSYFERCHNYNDNNCDYTLEDQEIACKKYLLDHSSSNNTNVKRSIYYYGIYNNYVYDYIVRSDGTIYILNNKEVRSYETTGIYIIEDLLDSEDIPKNNFKIYAYLNEPEDFHRRMMLYVVHYDDRTIFCPYWENKPF